LRTTQELEFGGKVTVGFRQSPGYLLDLRITGRRELADGFGERLDRGQLEEVTNRRTNNGRVLNPQQISNCGVGEDYVESCVRNVDHENWVSHRIQSLGSAKITASEI
jgi:hypothetical protein